MGNNIGFEVGAGFEECDENGEVKERKRKIVQKIRNEERYLKRERLREEGRGRPNILAKHLILRMSLTLFWK